MHTSSTPTQPGNVLILGARGRFGFSAARAFAEAGWHVLGQMRPGAVAPTLGASRAALPPEGAVVDAAAPMPQVAIEWLGIDLHDTEALAQAAHGASVVIHALNPAYTNRAWQTQALPMVDAALAICRALDATLMVPGNVYNFGAGMPAVLREDTPQTARTVKGRVRIQMEERLRTSGVRSIVIRAGDFFGGGTGTWFDTAMVKDIRKGVFTYPGTPSVARAWAYLPDLARTFVAVAGRRVQLPVFDVLHFAGHRITGQRWVDVLQPIARAQGWVPSGKALKLAGLPWPIIRMGALFVPTWRALLEMAYLWDTPHALGNDKLVALIGAEPSTPLPQAALAALTDLGMLPAADRMPHRSQPQAARAALAR